MAAPHVFTKVVKIIGNLAHNLHNTEVISAKLHIRSKKLGRYLSLFDIQLYS